MSLHNVIYSAAEYQRQQDQPTQATDIGTDWIVSNSIFYQKVAYAYSIEIDGDGNVYTVITQADQSSILRKHIQKHNVYGVLLWEVKLSGEYSNTAVNAAHLKIDDSGNLYFVTSIRETSGSTYNVMRMAKISKDGVLLWQKIYRSSTNSISYPRIAINAGGEIFVTAEQAIGAGYGFWVAKFNNSGNLIWRKSYTNTAATTSYAIQILPNGDVVSLHTFTISGQRSRTLLAKHDQSGNLVLFKTYEHSTVGVQITSMVIGIDGNIYLAGRLLLGTNVGLVMKIDSSNLNIVWQKTLSSVGGGHVYLEGIDVDSDGCVFICGHDGSNGYDSIVTKLTSLGALEWCNRLHGDTVSSNESFRGLILDNHGYMVLGGYRTMNVDGYPDSVIARFPKDNGNLNKTYDAWVYQSNPVTIQDGDTAIDIRTYPTTTLAWTEETYAPPLKKIREFTVFS